MLHQLANALPPAFPVLLTRVPPSCAELKQQRVGEVWRPTYRRLTTRCVTSALVPYQQSALGPGIAAEHAQPAHA